MDGVCWKRDGKSKKQKAKRKWGEGREKRSEASTTRARNGGRNGEHGDVERKGRRETRMSRLASGRRRRERKRSLRPRGERTSRGIERAREARKEREGTTAGQRRLVCVSVSAASPIISPRCLGNHLPFWAQSSPASMCSRHSLFHSVHARKKWSLPSSYTSIVVARVLTVQQSTPPISHLDIQSIVPHQSSVGNYVQ